MTEPRTTEPWTAFETQRRAWVLAGYPVLANAHVDHRLIAWARQCGLLLRIDRQSDWGNRAILHNPRDDAERTACVQQYAAYFAGRPDLHARLPALSGRVLVCWCTPKACHGDVLLGALSPQFAAEYFATCQELLTPPSSTPGRSGQLDLFG
jgi:hypothetical protein